MLIYTYNIFYKHGFKYIDTSQYSFGLEYFVLGDIEIEYNRITHIITINNHNEDKSEDYYFHENSTDNELDNILTQYLRKHKLKQLTK